MSFNPFYSLIRTLGHVVHRRIHFSRNRVGEKFKMSDGQHFVIFRQVIIKPAPNELEKSEAIFKVRFQLANMTPKQNKRFSLVTIPFFVGLPGFRSKIWAQNEENGYCQGIYKWDSVQDAENYAQSFAMEFMTRRAVPGSISYNIISKKTYDNPNNR